MNTQVARCTTIMCSVFIHGITLLCMCSQKYSRCVLYLFTELLCCLCSQNDSAMCIHGITLLCMCFRDKIAKCQVHLSFYQVGRKSTMNTTTAATTGASIARVALVVWSNCCSTTTPRRISQYVRHPWLFMYLHILHCMHCIVCFTFLWQSGICTLYSSHWKIQLKNSPVLIVFKQIGGGGGFNVLV